MPSFTPAVAGRLAFAALAMAMLTGCPSTDPAEPPASTPTRQSPQPADGEHQPPAPSGAATP